MNEIIQGRIRLTHETELWKIILFLLLIILKMKEGLIIDH